MESFGFFCYFRYQLKTFFIWKKAITFSEKPTGQQMRAMLSVLNILINEVCRKFDKNCLKLLKIKLLEFLSFLGSIFWYKIAFISS